MSWLYEIRNPNDTLIKRDEGLLHKTPRRLPDAKTPRK